MELSKQSKRKLANGNKFCVLITSVRVKKKIFAELAELAELKAKLAKRL